MSVTRLVNTPDGFVNPDDIAFNTTTPVAADQVQMRVGAGAIRFTLGDGSPIQQGVTKYVHTVEGVQGGSILATLNSAYGNPSVQTEPGNEASRTDVRTAERMGLIRSNGRGGWEDVTNKAGDQRTLSTIAAEQHQVQQAQEQQQAAAVAESTRGIFDSKEDAQWVAEFDGIPDHAFRGTLALVTNAMVLGSDLDGAALRLAQETGMEPAQALEKVNLAVQLQQNIVDRALRKVGLDEAALVSFYGEAQGQPGRLQNALQYLMAGRDVSHFQQWGREYLAKTARVAASDPAAHQPRGAQQPQAAQQGAAFFQAAGFDTSRGRDGVLMVKPAGDDGRWVPASELLKA